MTNDEANTVMRGQRNSAVRDLISLGARAKAAEAIVDGLITDATLRAIRIVDTADRDNLANLVRSLGTINTIVADYTVKAAG